VIAADHPNRPVGFQHAAALGKPCAGEPIIVGETRKPVPGLMYAVDDGIVRSQKVAIELQIVGRIGEDEINAARRQLGKLGEAIALDHTIHKQGRTLTATLNHLTLGFHWTLTQQNKHGRRRVNTIHAKSLIALCLHPRKKRAAVKGRAPYA
jgi:hypothetical protein